MLEPKVPDASDPNSKTLSSLRVRFAETDLMGIVHHAAYLVYFETGRVEWLRRRGITYVAWTKRGVHLPVVSAELRYRATARFDDLLVVETTLAKLRAVSLDFAYRLTRPEDNMLIAEGETRLACVDTEHRLFRIPEDIRTVLLSGEIPTP